MDTAAVAKAWGLLNTAGAEIDPTKYATYNYDGKHPQFAMNHSIYGQCFSFSADSLKIAGAFSCKHRAGGAGPAHHQVRAQPHTGRRGEGQEDGAAGDRLYS